MLGTSRENPTKSPEATAGRHRDAAAGRHHAPRDDRRRRHGALVARRSASARSGAIRSVHVPKTIDNDLPLPPHVPTFGFQTARHVGVELVRNLMEDARSTRRWYVVVAMGRKAGHLALGIGKAAGATLTRHRRGVRRRRRCRSPRICDIVEGAIIKRRAMGRHFGVAVLAEGPDRQARSGGAGRAGGRRARRARPRPLRRGRPRAQGQGRGRRGGSAERGLRVTITHKNVGYELRCADPIPFDAEYCRDLGYSADPLPGRRRQRRHGQHPGRPAGADSLRRPARAGDRQDEGPPRRHGQRGLPGGARLHDPARGRGLRARRLGRPARRRGAPDARRLPPAVRVPRAPRRPRPRSRQLSACPSNVSASSSAAARRPAPTASSARSPSRPSSVGCVPIGFTRRLRLAGAALHRRAARADDRRGLAHPPRRRRPPRHLAPRRHARAPRASTTPSPRSAKLKIDALVCIGGDDMVRSAAAIALAQRHHGRAGAEEHRQRPVAAAAAADARLRDGAPRRRRHREEPDGGCQDDRPLVSRRDHGPADRPPDAGHRQGGERDLHDHPGGVPRTTSISLSEIVDIVEGSIVKRRAMGKALRRRPAGRRRWSSASARARSPSCRTSTATRRATSASPRSTSAAR